MFVEKLELTIDCSEHFHIWYRKPLQLNILRVAECVSDESIYIKNSRKNLEKKEVLMQNKNDYKE